VQQVAETLTLAGIRVFYDKYEETNLWGKNLVDHFNEIYSKQAKFCIIFISRHYAAKSWPNTERQAAQASAIMARQEYILPVRLDDTILPGLPSSVAYVDGRVVSPQKLCQMIQAKLGVKVATAPEPPQFPDVEDEPICPKGPHIVDYGIQSERELDIRRGDTILGSLRAMGSSSFRFEIVDEENLMEKLRTRTHGAIGGTRSYSVLAAGESAPAHFVKPALVPHNGPWFLILQADGFGVKVLLNLRRQRR